MSGKSLRTHQVAIDMHLGTAGVGLVDAFHAYLAIHEDECAFVGQDLKGQDVSLTRADIAKLVFAFARGLEARNVGEGDAIIIGARNCLEHWCLFWASQIAGVTVAMIPYVSTAKQLEERAPALLAAAQHIRAKLIVVDLSPAELYGAIGMTIASLSELPVETTRTVFAACDPNRVAVIQFTSGSTSQPKACALNSSGFVLNAEAILARLAAQPGDRFVSWLPTFHDMGLMTAFILPIVSSGHIVFRQTRRFLMRPLSWLQDLSCSERTHTGVPNFALALVSRHIESRPPKGLDLSHVQSIVCGAEPIVPNTVRRFLNATSLMELQPSAFHAAYGMAEATLMVSSRPGGLAVSVGKSRLRSDQEQVCVGHPIDDVKVEIRRGDGTIARSTEIGEVFIQSRCMMVGYIESNGLIAAHTNDGWFPTGDLGFVVDGELYITGRVKDLIIVAGHNLYPTVIEAALARAIGLEEYHIAVFGHHDALSTETMCVLVETKEKTVAGDLSRRILEFCVKEFDVAPSRILYARPGAILRTTSGKIRRAAIGNAMREGTLPLLPDIA